MWYINKFFKKSQSLEHYSTVIFVTLHTMQGRLTPYMYWYNCQPWIKLFKNWYRKHKKYNRESNVFTLIHVRLSPLMGSYTLKDIIQCCVFTCCCWWRVRVFQFYCLFRKGFDTDWWKGDIVFCIFLFFAFFFHLNWIISKSHKLERAVRMLWLAWKSIKGFFLLNRLQNRLKNIQNYNINYIRLEAIQ